MKLPNKYIAIDIETTDTDYQRGDVIQIGAVVINEDLTTGETFSTYITPLSKFRNPEAMAANKISEDELELAPGAWKALKDFEAFALFTDERPTLAAWGTYFDVNFLREYYKKVERKWPFHYRCLDLKSIAIWEAAKNGKSVPGGVSAFLETQGLTFEGTPHDGLDDIVNTVRIIQTYGKNS